MSDNSTTELLCKLLEERGIDYKLRRASSTSARETVYWEYEKDGDWASAEYAVTVPLEGHGHLNASSLTPEQAIAATLGALPDRHPYEQRITGDGSDWGEIMRGAYDDLMASACEACTPEQMRQLADYIRAELGSGTLTAEQVREAVMSADRWEKPMGDTGLTNTHLIIRDDGWQAIADELNAELGNPEIVRCRDCKFCHLSYCEKRISPTVSPSEIQWIPVEPDGFCAWAERKEVGE